jgi:hypothetical protein
MATWRKILVSGSNAHVAAITASVTGTPTDKSEVIFRDTTTGRFFSTGSIFFTASNGNQLFLDKTGLTAFNISASGTPDDVLTNSQVLFRNPNSTGIEATSSLFFNSSDQLEFSSSQGAGVFSGSFTGDGSGLTGVIGTLANSLVGANGIASSSGAIFSYNGNQPVTITVATASNGGLEFQSGGLRLASTLAHQGLYFSGTGTDNFTSMSIALTPGGTSGLTTGSDELAISSSIAGNGLAFSNGQVSVDLASNSGLTLTGTSPTKQLRLSAGLDGEGLAFSSNYDVLAVDTNFVVTSSNRVIFQTGSSNLTLTVTPNADLQTSSLQSGGGFSQKLINNPVVTYDLNTTLTGDFTFENDVNVEGNFTVSGTLTSASIETENLNISDQFVLVNSGSTGTDGGFVVQTATTTGAFLFYDGANKRWGVSNNDQTVTDTAHTVIESSHAALVTTTITNTSESVLINQTPLFGTAATNRSGQLAITTVAQTNESSVFIYA